MEVYHGVTAHKGIAAARIREAAQDAPAKINRQVSFAIRSVEDTDEELMRLDEAVVQTGKTFSELYERAAGEVGEHEASLFLAYGKLLSDEGFLRKVRSTIREEKINAEYAVNQASKFYEKMFRQMSDPVMSARADDIREVKARLITTLKKLSGGSDPSLEISEKGSDPIPDFIYCADELLAGDFIKLDKAHLKGLILRNGSALSHVAILAEAIGIPVLIRSDLPDIYDGKPAILDADSGQVFISPDAETAAKYRELYKEKRERLRMLKELKNADAVTKGGARVLLMANITDAKEAAEARENGADGIGLFRTEFLFISKNDFPTEEEQFRAYRKVLEDMEGRDVVIRTFDLGGDKNIEYMHSFGMRGVRLALQRADVMMTQMKALLRAAVYGNLRVMMPMVTSADEIRLGKRILENAQLALEREGRQYGTLKVGAMIETPAAVILAEELAKEADFFSIGTNDLTQYTLGASRDSQDMSGYFNPGHPAVLMEIGKTIRAAHEAGIPVGVCGEAAGNPVFAAKFIEMGVDSLSVSLSRLLPMRAAIREMR